MVMLKSDGRVRQAAMFLVRELFEQWNSEESADPARLAGFFLRSCNAGHVKTYAHQFDLHLTDSEASAAATEAKSELEAAMERGRL